MTNQPSKKAYQRKFGPAVSLGYTMTAGMLVFTGLGYYADRKTGHRYLWTIIGMFLGLAYAGYEVWKLVRISEKSDETDQGD